ncbi:uncharacterized protein LOC116961200 [Tyto alba]|uniref:uncharacterized protein LOC116961200 n=1 Tax=Tyto alba TaxID=56313 RepID=UPI001C67B2AC|nr:uncharacterized protein LOC116961200 [Tyto alba]
MLQQFALNKNPWTKSNVMSDNEPAAFHVHPGGIHVLPMFEIKPPTGKTADGSYPAEGSRERERSPPDKSLHHQKQRSPGNLTGAKEAKGGRDSRKRPVHNGKLNQLLARLSAEFQSEHGRDLGEDMAKRQEKEGSPFEKTLLYLRKLSPMTIAGLKRKEGKAEQALGVKPPPARSEFAQAQSGTKRPLKSLQQQHVEKGTGSPPEKTLLQRKLSPVTIAGLKRKEDKAEQALGVKPPPASVLPVTEGSSVQEGKSKTTGQGKPRSEIPVCKGHQRVGQEVCYLCRQQEERNLQAALLEEKEKQERAELAEQQAWQAHMAALNTQVLAALSATQRDGISLPQAGLAVWRPARQSCVVSLKLGQNECWLGWAGLGCTGIFSLLDTQAKTHSLFPHTWQRGASAVLKGVPDKRKAKGALEEGRDYQVRRS